MKKSKVIILVVFVLLTFPLHGSKWKVQAQSHQFTEFNVLNYTSSISLSPDIVKDRAPSFASRTLTNTVSTSSVAEDNSLSNNLVTENTIIKVSSPHFSLGLPSGYEVGTNNGWSIFQWKQVWFNSRNTAPIKIRIVDPIPADAIYVSNSLQYKARGSSVTDSCYYNSANNQVIWGGTIGVDSGATNEKNAQNKVIIKFKKTGTSGYAVGNQAGAYWDQNNDRKVGKADPNIENDIPVLTDDPTINTPNDSTVVKGSPKLSIIKVSNPPSVCLGSDFMYVIKVSNVGHTSADGVKISDTLPFGVQYVGSYPSGNFNLLTNGISWDIGVLQPNETRIFTITVKAVALGIVKNVATLTGTNFDSLSASATTNISNCNSPAPNPPTPTPNPINITINPPQRICINTDSKFVFTFTGGTPPYKYVVNFGDGSEDVKGEESGKFITLLHTYTKEGTYTVTINITDDKETTSTLTRTVTAENCEVVLKVYHHNFIIGYPDGMFKSDRKVTRAEIATMLTRALGLDAEHLFNHSMPFTDVKVKFWGFNFIKKSYEEKLMLGDKKGTFRPNSFATRAEIATILVRLRGLKPETPEEQLFTDVSSKDWFNGYVYTAVKTGLIQGYPDHSFKPNKSVTRAEFVTMLDRALYREDTPQVEQYEGLENIQMFPDVTKDFWAYKYILEAAFPHVITYATRAPINISIPSKTIPIYLASTKTVIIFPPLNTTVTAIVPVDGIINGKDPEPRNVYVRIINKEKP
jgi:uncharacterized repeat protein (TIGR01451 family)